MSDNGIAALLRENGVELDPPSQSEWLRDYQANLRAEALEVAGASQRKRAEAAALEREADDLQREAEMALDAAACMDVPTRRGRPPKQNGQTAPARRAHAPAGQRRDQVLAAIDASPDGLTIAEANAQLGFPPTSTALYGVQRRLLADGVIRKEGAKMVRA